MNTRYPTFLIAGLWLGVSASALAGHPVPRVDHAAEHLARAAAQWQATTHYVDGRSRQALLAGAVSHASREFNDQLRYRRSFEQLWVSWEVLATRFFQARELKHQLTYRHGSNIVRFAPFPYNMSHHQDYGTGQYRISDGPRQGLAYGATYEVVQESWRRMADAFYELRAAIRLERDRYDARHQGYRSAPNYGYRSDSVKDRYYRR